MPKHVSLHEQATLLRDAVFAANDGLITTFAVVAGSTGASLSPEVAMILGFANLFADGFSMASGNYLGVKSELDANHNKLESSHHHSPLRHGITTFIGFMIAGLLPLISYLFDLPNKFNLSVAVVSVSLFVVGSVRSIYTKKNFIVSGLEMLIIGGFAAFIAYITGLIIDRFVI